MTSSSEHILVLGATGASGLVFVKHVQSLSTASKPKLTLYLRNRSKLTAEMQGDADTRIVEGGLADSKSLTQAMQGVTTVVSFLGPYMSFKKFIFRERGPTPITDAMPVVFDAMRSNGVKRILTLSTPGGWPQEGEERLSWYWWLQVILAPKAMVPQGSAEMKGVAEQTRKQDDLDWTVYRVPFLDDGAADLDVVAGYLTPDYTGTAQLSRASMSKWILREIDERKWVKKAPLISNL